MPTFAELKKKAGGMKDTGVTKFQNTKDRHTSVPLKSTNWDPYNRNHQPSPSQSSVTSATSGASPALPPPPPIVRVTKPSQSANDTPSRPALPPPPSRAFQGGNKSPSPSPASIDWANLSDEDKEVFFEWLDEFFAAFLEKRQVVKHATGVPSSPSPPARSLPPATSARRVPSSASSVSFRQSTPVEVPAAPSTPRPSEFPARGPPPPVAKWSRPDIAPTHSASSISSASSFTSSYPPPTTYGSAAADIAQYFSHSTHWDVAWYSQQSNFIPPPLEEIKHKTWTGSWQMHGTQKTTFIAALFSDLSMLWGSVSFDTRSANDTTATEREVQYLPRPEALDEATLIQASETYGPTIAGFAETFLDTGEYCARGECWDLANEALKYFEQYDYIEKPVPSIGRTHGHLIFEGKAERGLAVGRWRGRDTRVRQGDIVEWRKVKITRVDAPRGSYSLLGDPEHTAVIVEDSPPPGKQPQDGQPLSPADLKTLTVVEQSVSTGGKPHRSVYDMSGFQEGEVWIYRPVGMKTYLGVEKLEVRAPEGLRTLSV